MIGEKNERSPAFRLWLDLETTGLDPKNDLILEAAWILTRYAYPYEEISTGSRLIRYPDNFVEVSLNSYTREMHTKNGLLAELAAMSEQVLAGPTLVEDELLELSKDWPTSREDKDVRIMLAGNSVDFDRGFLKTHMPQFASRLSHRVSDASAYYRFCRDLGMPERKHEEVHRAAADVRASLELARACAAWVLEGRKGFDQLQADESHNIWGEDR